MKRQKRSRVNLAIGGAALAIGFWVLSIKIPGFSEEAGDLGSGDAHEVKR